MIVFLFFVLLMYTIDVFLIGVVYYSLKSRFGWAFSPKKNLIILFILFMIIENYALPLLLIMDVTFTIGNPEIAKAFDLRPNEPVINLFGFGLFEFIIWAVQALAASYIGERFFGEDSIWGNITTHL